MGNGKFSKGMRCSGGKVFIGALLIVIIVLGVIFALNFMKGDETVEFRVLSEGEIPQDITGQVIPEYRNLERALACTVDDKIYVLVTRGEKPTSGYEIAIDRMLMEEKEGKGNLVVYANFTDPEPGGALAQVLTYPMQVAETELTELPDSIELRVQY